jgi:uncharacterized protein (DUF305 family)
MSADTTVRPDPEVDDDPAPVRPPNRGLRLGLLTIIAIAALVIAGALGYALNGNDTPAAGSAPNAVDVGFAQDMATHHVQAVTMAGYERDTTSNPTLKTLAFDIETAQEFQVGEMQGWLDQWNKPRNDPDQMSWMGSGMGIGPTALMPGMATAAQLTKLESSTGKPLDILFLQLMIHHHQGGLQMAAYGRDHAANSSVVRLAGAMYTLQSQELVQMEQLLRSLGGTPLPPPEH